MAVNAQGASPSTNPFSSSVVSLTAGATSGVTVSQSVIGGLILEQESEATLEAGSNVGLLQIYEAAAAEIFGGQYSVLEVADDAELDIFGGTLLGDRLIASEQSFVTIHGTRFDRPLGLVTDLAGTITGNLLDGSPFSLDFQRLDPMASILLVPEPTTVVLLALAMLALTRAPRIRVARPAQRVL